MNKLGFVITSVLVALAIVAVSVMAGMRAAASMTRNADRQWQVLLAQACADNALYRLRLGRSLPNVGESRVTCPQAELALDEYLQDSLLIIEWPDRLGDGLWSHALFLTIMIEPDGARRLTARVPDAWTDRWSQI